jgi:hypothetical protein
MTTDPETWPDAVRGLPVCPKRQLPIPYSAERDENGIGIFTALDPVHKDRIIRHRLCGLCGEPLGSWITFLGDEHSLEPEGFFIDPPMHEKCSEAAILLCPFIAGERVPRRPATPDDVMTAPPGTFENLTKHGWVMAYTRGFRAGWYTAFGASDQTQVFYPRAVTRIRRFEYRDGRLEEVPGGV